MRKWMIGLVASMLITTLAGCSSTSNKESTAVNTGTTEGKTQTLRIAMGSPGEGLIKVWEDIGKECESQHAGIKVEFN